jgi:hypothetical protein
MSTKIYAGQDWVEEKLVETQSDWNQNDETKPDYVKNRTHWESDPQEVTVLAETTPIDGGVSLVKALEEGKEYIVTFNGVAYPCVARNYDGYLMLGNNAVYEYDNGDVTDTGEPFAIESQANSGTGPLSDEETVAIFATVYEAEGIDLATARISITTMESIVHTLDLKYLPDLGLPETFEGVYVGRRSENGGEIFNGA